MPRNPAASAGYFHEADSSALCSSTIAIAMETRPSTASMAEWSGSWCQRQSGHKECMMMLASNAPTLHTVTRRYGRNGRFHMAGIVAGARLLTFRTQARGKIKAGAVGD